MRDGDNTNAIIVEIVFNFREYKSSHNEKVKLELNKRIAEIGSHIFPIYSHSSKDEPISIVSEGKKKYSLIYEVEDFDDIKKEYTKIKERFNYIKKIQVFPTESKGKNKKDTKSITIEQLRAILSVFIRQIGDVDLEILLSNVILNNIDCKFSKKELALYDVKNPSLRRVLRKKDLQRTDVISLISMCDHDPIVIRALHFLIERLSYVLKFKDLYKLTGNILGKELDKIFQFDPEEIHFSNLKCKLELFFKTHYLIDKIERLKEEYNKKHKREKVIKFVIPLNPKKYNFERLLKEEVCTMLKNAFYEVPDLVIGCYERVLTAEFKRLYNIEINNCIFKFDFEESDLDLFEQKQMYYKKIENLIFDIQEEIGKKSSNNRENLNGEDEKAEKVSEEIEKFVLMNGYYQKDSNVYKFDTTLNFRLIDFDKHTIECKIKQFKRFFKNLNISNESEIILQGIFRIKYEYNKKTDFRRQIERHITVRDIKIIDRFEDLEIWIGDIPAGKRVIENTRQGVSIKIYTEKSVFNKPILSVPLILEEIYQGQNELYYEITLDTETLIKTKEEIIDYIREETTLAIETNPSTLEMVINNILRTYKEEGNFSIKPMYNVCGVLRNEEGELVLVYPDHPDLTVIGENDSQKEINDNIREKGIDWNGNLTPQFYKILHIDTVRENPRLGVYAYAAIEPFFIAIKDKLDIFPNFYLIGKKGSGKTTLSETIINYGYGTQLKTPEDFDSTARVTHYATSTPFPLNIDDIDDLDPKVLGYIKTNSTRKSPRERLNQDSRSKRSEETYASYAGSANFNKFLLEDEAFRMRCIIFYLRKSIKLTEKNKKKILKFRNCRDKIIKGKVYGFYLLKNALEFIDKEVEVDTTLYKKLIMLLEETQKKIDDFILDNNIYITDVRRHTIYALLYLGWQFWQYTFRKHDLESTLINQILDLKTNRFKDFIEELEYAEQEITLDIIENVVSYYENLLENKSDYPRFVDGNGNAVLTSDFVNGYDQFARRAGYETIGTVKELARLESLVLNREIEADTIYIYDKKLDKKRNKHGVRFHHEEIKVRRLKGVSLEEIKEDSESLKYSERDVETVDIDKIFGLTEAKKKEIRKRDNLIVKLKRMFESDETDLLELKSVRQALEIDFPKEFVQRCLEHLFEEGILKETGDYCRLNLD